MKFARTKPVRPWLGSLLALTLLVVGACSERSDRGVAPEAAGSSTTQAQGEGTKCAAHGAPKELCFICDPALREPGRLWCAEHQRYEDRCFLCHPELRDPNRLYCEEHGVYEDECFLCHPELLKKKPSETARGDATPAGLMCREHDVPEAECGICHPELLGRTPGAGLKVRLASKESAAKAGVAIQSTSADPMPHGIECLAELTFDQNRVAEIASPVEGLVRAIDVDLGGRVQRGQILARLTSAAMGEAQGDYLKALAEEELRLKALERERQLHAQRIASQKEVEEAEAAQRNATAAARQAEQHLIVLGLSERQIRELGAQQVAPGEIELRAPFAGEVVERRAVLGTLAEAGRPLFVVADTAGLWAMLSIPEPQLTQARVGQAVQLTVEALPGETFEGRLTWLASAVDERTRMARARVEVRNLDGRLKAQMFARALIVTSDSAHAIVVPRSAVQQVGGTPLVFVREGEDLFEARTVRLGASHGNRVEVVAGLGADEPIVVAGGFALKSQLLISRLGAGCAD